MSVTLVGVATLIHPAAYVQASDSGSLLILLKFPKNSILFPKDGATNAPKDDATTHLPYPKGGKQSKNHGYEYPTWRNP